MRLFFALWPPPEAARALAQWAREAQRQTGGRVTDEAKIHLTLAFLGDAEPALALAAGRRVKARTHDLPMEQARYWRVNNIVWAGPRELPASLKALHAVLSTELRRERFVLEERRFAAHVTLIRKARAPKALPPLPPLDWPVNEFALVGSSLSPKGPAYRTLERFSLG